jgi:hypothetical protein
MSCSINQGISELVKFLFCQMDSGNFTGRLCLPWGLNWDPTTWLDVARPPPNYKLLNYMTLVNMVTMLSNWFIQILVLRKVVNQWTSTLTTVQTRASRGQL